MSLTPRRELVQFLMKNSNIDKNDLCLLESINLEDLIKKKRTCRSVESEGNLNVLCGTIRQRDFPKTNIYYSVKAFLSFEIKSLKVPCFVAHDCLRTDILNCKVVVHEWTFVWQEPRGGVDAYYLELNKILPMTSGERYKKDEDGDKKLFSTLHVKECFELLSKLDLKTSSDESDSFPVNVFGKVHSVSEIYRVFPEQWSFCFRLEDVEVSTEEGGRVLVKCDVDSFLWVQSMLKLGGSYFFTNLVARVVQMEDESVECLAVTAETQVQYVEEEGPTDFMSFLSSDDAVKHLNVSAAKSRFGDDSSKKPKSWPPLDTLTGSVTEASDSTFGIMTIDDKIRVHMHGSGHGCFEHIREGCEVVLENVHSSKGRAIGCQMSRLLVLRYPCRDLQSSGKPRKVRRFASNDEGSKFHRIVSELVELCRSTPSQLESLLEQIGIPQKQFCPRLVSAINYRTYSGFFATTIFRPSAGSNRDDADMKRMEVTSVPLLPVKRFSSKLEQFISSSDHDFCSDAARGKRSKKIKFMTVEDLITLGADDELFRRLDSTPNYWECKVMSSSTDRPDNSVYVLGFLKSNGIRGCVSLVDSKGSIECVVADSNPAGDYFGHSCSESDSSCRTHCQMSHAPCQLPTCPYLQSCHLDCLVRIDSFHLVSETFHSTVVDSQGRLKENRLERRYLLFSAASAVSFGPHLLLEMGISSYPFWPHLRDVECYINDKFSERPSDLTPFTFVPSDDLRMDENLMNRFGFETLVLKSYLEGNRDFSSAALKNYLNSGLVEKPDSTGDVCACSLSLVFAVKHKEGLITRVEKPKDAESDFNAEDFLNEYFKRSSEKRPRPDGASPKKRLRVDFRSSSDERNSDEMIETGLDQLSSPPCAETSSGSRELGSESQPLNEPFFDILKPPKSEQDGKIRNANFFRTKIIYEFGAEVFAVDFVDDVCQLCRSNKTHSSRANSQFKASECPSEMLLVFRDECAGWHPVLRLGCIYTLEVKRATCSALRQHLRQTTEALPTYLKNKSLTSSGWKYVVEVRNTVGVALNRHFRNWHLEDENRLCLNGNEGAEPIGRKVRAILDDLDRETRFESEVRSPPNADLETVIGVVVSKKFNSKNSSSEYDDPVNSERISKSGLSVPGSRKVVVTLRVLGSVELVKVSTPENAVYKYPLGVLVGCCVCFRRVFKTDFTGQGKHHSYRLYNFLPTSSLELVSFPTDLFGQVDVDHIKEFRFNGFRKQSRCDPPPETGLDGRPAGPESDNDRHKRRCDDGTSGDGGRGSVGEKSALLTLLLSQLNRSRMVAEVPKQIYLRELLYMDESSLPRGPVSLNVFISRILWVSFSFSCPVHTSYDTGMKEHLLKCPACMRPFDKFKVKMSFEACDSTSKAFVTCDEERLVRKTLAVPEKGWTELKQLIGNRQSKSFYFDGKRPSYRKGHAIEYDLDDGLDGDLKLFLTMLVDSNLVKRRVIATAKRFRTVLDQKGCKLPRLVHGARPSGPASKPIERNQFDVARRSIVQQLVDSAPSGEEGRSRNSSLSVQLELKDIDDIDVDAQCWAAQKRLEQLTS